MAVKHEFKAILDEERERAAEEAAADVGDGVDEEAAAEQ